MIKSFYFASVSLLLAACTATGLGASGPFVDQQIANGVTPRSKGGSLSLTPRSKGGTLLSGQIIWPESVETLASKVFIIRVYRDETLLIEGETNESAAFEIQHLPPNANIRIEAWVPKRPFVRLKQLYQTASDLSQSHRDSIQLSMLSTAAEAVIQQSTAASILRKMPPQRILRESTQVLEPLAERMTPYLDEQSLTQPIESQADVKGLVAEVAQTLESQFSSRL